MVLGIWFLVDARTECVWGCWGGGITHLAPPQRGAAAKAERGSQALLIFYHPQDPPRTSQQSGCGQCGSGPGILR